MKKELDKQRLTQYSCLVFGTSRHEADLARHRPAASLLALSARRVGVRNPEQDKG